MPIKLNIFEQYLKPIYIIIHDKTAPVKLYIKLDILPVISISTTLLRAETTKPSLNPNKTKETKTTIFERPNLAPGIVRGKGIDDSKTLKPSPVDTKTDKKIILFNFFIKSSFYWIIISISLFLSPPFISITSLLGRHTIVSPMFEI